MGGCSLKATGNLKYHGIVLIAFLVSCSSDIPRRPSQEEVLNLGWQNHAPARDRIQVRNNDVSIIIDNSRSMAGFNEPTGMSIYSQFLQEILSVQLGNYGKSFYRFQGNVLSRIEPSEVWNATIDDGFYMGGETRLGDIIGTFCNLPDSELSRAYVVISDGVTSTHGGSTGGMGSDYTLMVREINEWQAIRGLEFAIICIRSQFDGPAYSEVNVYTAEGPHGIGTYTSDPESIESFRPFYALIFATDAKVKNDLLSLFRGSKLMKKASRVLEFRHSFVEMCKVNFSIPSIITGDWKNPVRLLKQPDAENPNLIYLRWEPRGEFRSPHGTVIINANLVLCEDCAAFFSGDSPPQVSPFDNNLDQNHRSRHTCRQVKIRPHGKALFANRMYYDFPQ